MHTYNHFNDLINFDYVFDINWFHIEKDNLKTMYLQTHRSVVLLVV